MSVEVSAACKRLDYTGATRAVLLEFADAANDDGLCWPSRARMMYNTGLSETRVKQVYKKLRKDGVIEHIGYAEYVEKGKPVRVHETGGRGRFPIYRVRSERGKKKPPFEEWLEERLEAERGAENAPHDEAEKGGHSGPGRGVISASEGGQFLTQKPSDKEPSSKKPSGSLGRKAPDAPEKKPKKKQPRYRPKKTPDEYANDLSTFMEHDPLADKVQRVIDLAASKNKSGEMAYSRAVNSFVVPIVEARKTYPEGAIAFALDEMIRNEKPDVRYALGVLRNNPSGPPAVRRHPNSTAVVGVTEEDYRGDF